jgi:hypothetical protein
VLSAGGLSRLAHQEVNIDPAAYFFVGLEEGNELGNLINTELSHRVGCFSYCGIYLFIIWGHFCFTAQHQTHSVGIGGIQRLRLV